MRSGLTTNLKTIIDDPVTNQYIVSDDNVTQESALEACFLSQCEVATEPVEQLKFNNFRTNFSVDESMSDSVLNFSGDSTVESYLPNYTRFMWL